MNILQEIIARRIEDIRSARQRLPAVQLESAAARRRHRSLRDLLLVPTSAPMIIAEIKRASPSAGPINPGLSPAALARQYHQNGACAISILTEPRYFLGENNDIAAARQAVPLPLLRKDFIVDQYQVIETAAIGADILLLIAAALEASRLRDLFQAASACGLECLIEVHDEHELDLALEYPAALIGVNSRNLKTLATDLEVARRLAKRIPPDVIAVAESGIRTRHEIRQLQDLGYRAFLIGQSLLGKGQPGSNLRKLLKPPSTPPPDPHQTQKPQTARRHPAAKETHHP